MGFLASGTVRHGVVALNRGVVLGRDVHLVDGEAVVRAAHGRTAAATLLSVTGDALVVAGGRLAVGALVHRVLALEATEVEVAVRADGSVRSTGPVETALLLAVALVVGVLRGAIARSVLGEAGCRSEAGSEANCHQGSRVSLHCC